jgi:N-acetyl-anhydromuramyl-L-alanine amidase AmpD
MPEFSDSTDLMSVVQPEVAINRTSLRLPDGQYLATETPKNLIVLHFTAGTTAKSAYNTWVNDPQRIATAYIVDRDGEIYEAFDPKYWAYALGIKGGMGPVFEKRAIQVEIANVGPLKLRGDKLCWWPNDFNAHWCDLSETHKYVKSSFRGNDYYAAFPDEQFLAVCSLVKQLCETFNIPKQIPPEEKLMQTDLEWFANYSGIASHQNVRADKFDIGPAFNWTEFNRQLQLGG